MQTNSPYPLAQPAPGILDLIPTLQATLSIPHNFICANIPPLSFLLLADRLAELYELVFPDRPEWLSGEVVDWEDETEVAAAVEQFLARVSTLFPVHDDIWDVDPSANSGEALEVVEWRLYEIPVITMGYDEWYDGWDDLKEPASYLLHMRYSRRDEDSPYLRDEFAGLYPDQQVPRHLESHRLVKILREMALPEPLDALPDLIEMLDHSTGNSFLDVGELSLAEGGGYPPWNQEDVEWLAAEWQKAKPILDRIHQLLDWQNSTPEEIGFKLTAVRDALLDAYQQTLTCPAETN
jgi:hypothetical protein